MTTTIPLEPCTSSNLAAYGYDPKGQRLAVQFQSGHVFYYANVPVKVYFAMQQATSKGSFVAHEIKGHFSAEKVTGTCVCGDVGLLGEVCTDCGTGRYSQTPRG